MPERIQLHADQHAALGALLYHDGRAALDAVERLTPAALAALHRAAVQLADLTNPRHRCGDCGDWTPEPQRVYPGRHLGGAMRCDGCAQAARAVQPLPLPPALTLVPGTSGWGPR